eukprot:gene11245-7813_t
MVHGDKNRNLIGYHKYAIKIILFPMQAFSVVSLNNRKRILESDALVEGRTRHEDAPPDTALKKVDSLIFTASVRPGNDRDEQHPPAFDFPASSPSLTTFPLVPYYGLVNWLELSVDSRDLSRDLLGNSNDPCSTPTEWGMQRVHNEIDRSFAHPRPRGIPSTGSSASRLLRFDQFTEGMISVYQKFSELCIESKRRSSSCVTPHACYIQMSALAHFKDLTVMLSVEGGELILFMTASSKATQQYISETAMKAGVEAGQVEWIAGGLLASGHGHPPADEVDAVLTLWNVLISLPLSFPSNSDSDRGLAQLNQVVNQSSQTMEGYNICFLSSLQLPGSQPYSPCFRLVEVIPSTASITEPLEGFRYVWRLVGPLRLVHPNFLSHLIDTLIRRCPVETFDLRCRCDDSASATSAGDPRFQSSPLNSKGGMVYVQGVQHGAAPLLTHGSSTTSSWHSCSRLSAQAWFSPVERREFGMVAMERDPETGAEEEVHLECEFTLTRIAFTRHGGQKPSHDRCLSEEDPDFIEPSTWSNLNLHKGNTINGDLPRNDCCYTLCFPLYREIPRLRGTIPSQHFFILVHTYSRYSVNKRVKMGAINNFFVTFSIFTLLVVTSTFPSVPLASAERYVVVDTDGNIEHYAALLTLSRLDSAAHVRIISVTNAGWGYAGSASWMLRRFVSLLPSLNGAAVTLGALESASERNIASEKNVKSACVSSRGFPSTPFDAAQRGMPVSRVDVSFAFTVAAEAPETALDAALPLAPAPSETTFEKLTALVADCQPGDTIVYLQLGGPTSTLAQIIERWKHETPSIKEKFFSLVQLHVLDEGYAGGADSVAISSLLSDSENFFFPIQLYVPSFFGPSMQFNDDRWSAFAVAAEASASPAAEWLFQAWSSKKTYYSTAGQKTFYSASFPSSSLVALCAMEPNYRNTLCPAYGVPSTSLRFSFSLTAVDIPLSSDLTNAFVHVFHENLTGDNLTSPFAYLANYSTSYPFAQHYSYWVFVDAAAGRCVLGDVFYVVLLVHSTLDDHRSNFWLIELFVNAKGFMIISLLCMYTLLIEPMSSYSNTLSLLEDFFFSVKAMLGWLPADKKIRVLILGLDNAGKTSILYRLHLGNVVSTVPTVGFNLETVQYKNVSFEVWDLGGQTGIRPYWRCYYSDTDAIIYVVDSADKDRMGVAKQELFALLDEDELKRSFLLVFANKQDLDTAASEAEVASNLGVASITNRTWKITKSSAKTGEGLAEGMDWLVDQLRNSGMLSVVIIFFYSPVKISFVEECVFLSRCLRFVFTGPHIDYSPFFSFLFWFSLGLLEIMDFYGLQDSLKRAGSNVGSSGAVSIEERYILQDKIGRGAYGIVWRGRKRCSSSETEYAIKQINLRLAGDKGLKDVSGEVETMSLLNHPNIVRLEETFKDDTSLWIVMEYLPGGELQQVLKERCLSEDTTRVVVTQLLEALEYIHDRGIVHRDLKPSNCLLSEEDLVVKISDFGFAVLAGSDQCLTTYCGTVAFMAPEILLDKNYGKPVDMWALGIMTYMMFVGGFPFSGDKPHELTRAICKSKDSLGNEEALKRSPLLRDFIAGLLTEDPNKRLTAKEALKHPWVKAGAVDAAQSAISPQKNKTSAVTKKAIHRFRAACIAVLAVHRLIYWTKYRRLVKIESEQISVLRDLHYMITGVFDPKSPFLDCSEIFCNRHDALEVLFTMLESTRTVERLDLSKNNIDSLSVIQNLLKVLSRHGSITSINLSDNPIPALAARGILRLARNPTCRLRHVLLEHTTIPNDIIQQINTALKDKVFTETVSEGPSSEKEKSTEKSEYTSLPLEALPLSQMRSQQSFVSHHSPQASPHPSSMSASERFIQKVD